MIKSMTGFASGECSTDQGELFWELRSVNHRYFETQFKLPDGFRAIETELRDLAASKLRRGKLDASLQFRPSMAAGASLEINEPLALELIEKAERLAQRIDDPEEFSALDIMRWPGVVNESTIDTSDLFEPARKLLDQTLDSLCEARAREGARIHSLLEERIAQIGVLAEQVRARMPEVLAALRQRINERAQALEVRVDAERLEQELVLLAQKLDVAEELDRLDAHVEEIRAAFAMDEVVGRRLDFLMQELNREANTLGSKSADAETTKAAVDLKVLIEQLREQIQNVE
ncbi:MAG: YicC family protein [Gammaproteobacteria bacterium]|jgi:uncharacterized protein (TIGR00255 family)